MPSGVDATRLGRIIRQAAADAGTDVASAPGRRLCRMVTSASLIVRSLAFGRRETPVWVGQDVGDKR